MKRAVFQAIIDLICMVDSVTTDQHTKALLRLAYQLLKALCDEATQDEAA